MYNCIIICHTKCCYHWSKTTTVYRQEWIYTRIGNYVRSVLVCRASGLITFKLSHFPFTPSRENILTQQKINSDSVMNKTHFHYTHLEAHSSITVVQLFCYFEIHFKWLNVTPHRFLRSHKLGCYLIQGFVYKNTWNILCMQFDRFSLNIWRYWHERYITYYTHRTQCHFACWHINLTFTLSLSLGSKRITAGGAKYQGAALSWLQSFYQTLPFISGGTFSRFTGNCIIWDINKDFP